MRKLLIPAVLSTGGCLLVPAVFDAACAQNAVTADSTPSAAADSTTSASADTMTEVVVAGIRESVQAAQELKRLAPSVVEAITIEDLGKFTDTNIADALQRVPGINIERSSGTFDAGYGITIRGLGAEFSSSTLNGRELLGIPDFFGAGGRQFDFQTVPPEVLSGVMIYKTSTASQVEPGLSGQVNMQTLRPLDYRTHDGSSYFGSFSASEGYEDQSRMGSPRFGGTIGGKFFDDTLGAYVAGLYADDWADKDLLEHYAGRVDFSLDNGVTYPHELVNLYGYDIWRAHEKRAKRSAAAGVQWKPSSGLELNGDFEFNDSAIIRRDQADYWYPAIGAGGFGSQPYPVSSVQFGSSGQGVVGWDATQMQGLGGYATNYLGALHIDYTNKAYNGGLNAAWRNEDGRIKVIADYAYSATDYFISWLHPYIDNGTTSTYLETVNATGVRPIIDITNTGSGGDASNPASYQGLTYAENFQKRNRGNRNAFRLDLQAGLNDALTFETGARYAHTDTRFVSMARNDSEFPTSLVNAFTSNLNHLPFINYATPQVNFDGFCASNPNFCSADNRNRGSLTGPFPDSANGKPGDVLGLNTGESYEVVESNTALYGQLDFDDRLMGLHYSGNAGLRAVRISERGAGFQGSCNKIGWESGPCLDGTTKMQLVTDTNDYWTILPSLNVNLMPLDPLAVRLSASRSMTLPTYQQLAPIGKADIMLPDANGNILGPNIAQTGNTKLKPTKAWNYDFTTEYYTNYGGAYIASLFYKDVKDLIINSTLSGVTVPGQGNILFDSTTALNASTGFTYGAELGTNQPFRFLPSPWDGFGAQANYTYVVSRTFVSGEPTQFPGSSKNNVNTTLYYEKFGFSARVAVSYRSQYLVAFADGNTIARAETRVDASLSQKLTPHFEVILTGANLTHSYRSLYDQTAGFVTSYYSQPTTYSLGVRATF